MRSPFTGIVFVLELTHDINILLPLVLAVTIAHAFTVLTMRRSILTEKVSRRGYHLSREYAVDPLEVLFVREVMRTDVAAFQSSIPLKELGSIVRKSYPRLVQGLYPVADPEGHFVGVMTRSDIRKYIEEQSIKTTNARIRDVLRSDPVDAYLDEPLTAVVNRMARTGFTGFPVVERGNPQKLLGLISLNDLLKARIRRLEEEERRERVLPLHLVFPRGTRRPRIVPMESIKSGVEMKHETEGNWVRVGLDFWDGITRGFDTTNAKMVCQECHREFPFDWKCKDCGSSKLVLGTAAEKPGIFCSICHKGQWHWDCPNCGRRQDFASSFFYNKNVLALGARPRAA